MSKQSLLWPSKQSKSKQKEANPKVETMSSVEWSNAWNGFDYRNDVSLCLKSSGEEQWQQETFDFEQLKLMLKVHPITEEHCQN